jgi:NADPH:quinone reductase-like Zn-dependent oxidoreductase
VIGYDVEGVVVGADQDDPACSRFSVGDAVYGFAGGSIAEYAVLQCRMTGESPKSLSPIETAGLPVVALTSMVAWDRSNLTRGMRGLVIGASGGCGTFGVTLGKAVGAHITGICSTRNVALVESLGADAVIDYKDERAMQVVKAGGAQFDVIYDTVSSFAPEDPYYESEMQPLLKPGGKYVAINGSPMDWTRGILEQFVFKPLLGMSIQRPDFDLFLVRPSTANLDRLTKLIDNKIVPATVIDKTFPLDEKSIDAAFRRMKSRRTVGKIVFEVMKR